MQPTRAPSAPILSPLFLQELAATLALSWRYFLKPKATLALDAPYRQQE